ncbi:MAG: CBS domain-containing protein [Bacteroidetes bacterium]|nr:CBS domain-containing protein [Fibrella sp.]
MLAAELIDPMLPALKPTDTVGQALEWMQEHRIGQLVMTDLGEYRGIISEDLLLDVPDEDRPLSDVMQLHELVHALEGQHLFELLRLVVDNHLDVLAVVGEGNEFLGTISATELLRQFSQDLGVQEVGAVVVLSLDERDYSMAEISRLVESNNVKIISSYFSSSTPGSADRSTLTLKLNRQEVVSVISTLERFGYQIDGIFASAPIENIDQERLDSLLRYLNT